MTPNPLISIIIPVYNGEKYLAECIDSVINQSYRNIEIIIVNDGSTDRSSQIIEDYAGRDSRIKVLTQPNQGPSAARNSGLDISRGEYVVFTDCDDTITLDFVEHCLAYCGDVDIVAAEYSDRVARIGATVHSPLRLSADLYLEKLLYQTLSSVSCCGKMFRRSLFDAERFWNKRYEDLEIFPRLLQHCSSVTLTGRIEYYYRPNDSSFIHNFSPGRLDALTATDSIVETCRRTGKRALIKASLDRKLSANFNLFLLMYGRPGYETKAQDCWRVIVEQRWQSLFNGHVRAKNKIGILVSLMGKRVLSACNKLLKICV